MQINDFFFSARDPLCTYNDQRFSAGSLTTSSKVPFYKISIFIIPMCQNVCVSPAQRTMEGGAGGRKTRQGSRNTSVKQVIVRRCWEVGHVVVIMSQGFTHCWPTSSIPSRPPPPPPLTLPPSSILTLCRGALNTDEPEAEQLA